jgi:anti-sigma B factor antagonist
VHGVSFPVEMARGVPVVTAPEEIDINNAAGLRVALFEAAARSPGMFVVDMTLTHFCDTAGLHALVAANKRAAAEGGEILLVIPSTTILRIFAITGVDQVIPNFASLDEALAQRHPPSSADGHRRPGDEAEDAEETGLSSASPA